MATSGKKLAVDNQWSDTSAALESWRLRMDDKRRVTIPTALLLRAGIASDEDLVAYAEAGRVVLETRQAITQRLQDDYAKARAAGGKSGSAVEELLNDRAIDAKAGR